MFTTTGSKGNKGQHKQMLQMSAILAFPVMALHVYYMRYQTYVLKVEELINGVSIGFSSVQFFMCVLASNQAPRPGSGRRVPPPPQYG